MIRKFFRSRKKEEKCPAAASRKTFPKLSQTKRKNFFIVLIYRELNYSLKCNYLLFRKESLIKIYAYQHEENS
jgi:hypothetical protein